MKVIFSFLRKYWKFIVGWIALAMVVVGCNETILWPTNTLKLSSPTYFVKNDKVFALVDKHHERLVFANKDGEVVRVVKVNHRDLPFDKVNGIFFLDDHIMVSASVSTDRGIVLTKEALLEYSQEGNFIRKRYQTDYAREEDMVRAGFQYVEKSDWGLLLTSFRIGEIRYEEVNYQGAKLISSRKLDFMPRTAYRINEFECLIQGVDGWYRHYDRAKDEMVLLDRTGTSYEKYITDSHDLPQSLLLSQKLLVKTYLFWGAVGVLVLLGLLLLYDLAKLLRKDTVLRNRVYLIVGVIVLALGISIYYTNYAVRGTYNHYTTLAEVECRIAYDNLVNEHSKFFQLLKEKDINDILNNYEDCRHIQEYSARMTRVTTANGPHEAFSGAMLIRDKYGRTLIIADTVYDYSDGEVYWDKDVKDKGFEDRPDVFVELDDEKNEVFQTAFRKLYRDDGTCFGFLNMDINTKKIYNRQEVLVFETTVKLLIFMIAVYILWKFLSTAVKEFKKIRWYKKKGEQIIGGELINTCTFLSVFTISLDEVLWAFAAIELCEGYSGYDNIMMGIIVVAAAIATFFTTFIFPELRSWFSDTTVLVIGIFGVLWGLAMKWMAFTHLDPWFYIFGFSVCCGSAIGIYIPSVLALALQFKDEELRSKAINESYVSYAMATAAALLLGTFIQNTYGFRVLYVFAMVLIVAVSPLLIYAVSRASSAQRDHRNFNYRMMWKFFFNFRGLGYLFTMLLPKIIIGLFAAKFCGAILADVGMDSYNVTNITVVGLTLFSLFPSEKLITKYGMKMAGIIVYCTLAIHFLLVGGNNRIGWIIIVSIITSTMFSHAFGNNVLLKMGEEDGYDKKAMNDGNVFLENFFAVPISWFLGSYMGISEIAVFQTGGMMILGAVVIGLVFSKLGDRCSGASLRMKNEG